MILTTSNGTAVYDETGKPIFELSDNGYSTITDYSEGLAVVDNKACVDINGQVVFSFADIDFSNIK